MEFIRTEDLDYVSVNFKISNISLCCYRNLTLPKPSSMSTTHQKRLPTFIIQPLSGKERWPLRFSRSLSRCSTIRWELVVEQTETAQEHTTWMSCNSKTQQRRRLQLSNSLRCVSEVVLMAIRPGPTTLTTCQSPIQESHLTSLIRSESEEVQMATDLETSILKTSVKCESVVAPMALIQEATT